MTVITTARAAHPEAVHEHGLKQLWALTWRSFLGRLRQPAMLAPPFIFPLFFCALSSSSFSRAIEDPRFPPVDSFLHFAFAGAVLQGVMFGATQGASDLATDIEIGFFDRLVASPIRRAYIVLGRLGGSFGIGVLQAVVFTIVLAPFGVTIKSGVIGFLAIALSAGLIAVAIGSLLSIFAIRTGSAEVVQGAFPLVFVLLFMSSAFFARETMTGWFRQVADINPMSHLVEGIRGLVISDLNTVDLAKAILIPIAIAAVGVTFSLRALRRRITA
jgi:ABC-2 type transport system permease protein